MRYHTGPRRPEESMASEDLETITGVATLLAFGLALLILDPFVVRSGFDPMLAGISTDLTWVVLFKVLTFALGGTCRMSREDGISCALASATVGTFFLSLITWLFFVAKTDLGWWAGAAGIAGTWLLMYSITLGAFAKEKKQSR